MSKVVVDASVTLAWCFADESDAYADKVYDALAGHTILVPELWGVEIANGIVVGERKKRIAPADLAGFLSLLSQLEIVEEPQTLSHQLQNVAPFARKSNLTVYDACYLELAIRHGAPLATLDVQLGRAAEILGVPLFPA